MSEQVVPTEPGWWWVVYDGAACDETVVEVFDDECGGLRFRGPLVEGEPLVTARLWVWLEPVAPLGTAARLAAAEAELADLKRRIAEALECVTGFRSAVWAYGCKSERDELETLHRLLEVRDGENPGL